MEPMVEVPYRIPNESTSLNVKCTWKQIQVRDQIHISLQQCHSSGYLKKVDNGQNLSISKNQEQQEQNTIIYVSKITQLLL